MNEREEFLRYFQSSFATMVERIQTMTESQVLDGLREVKAARSIYDEEFVERMQTMTEAPGLERPREPKAVWNTCGGELTLLNSIQAFLNSIDKLRLQSGARARSGGNPPCLFDTIEDVLNERLETLRGNGKQGVDIACGNEMKTAGKVLSENLPQFAATAGSGNAA